MRKLVIALGNGFGIKEDEELERIAAAGWDGVFTGWNEGKGNFSLANKIKELGLMYQSVHAPFDGAAKMWEDDERGDYEVQRQLLCLRHCAHIGVNLVIMHAYIGFKNHSPSQMGVDKFGILVREAEKLGVKIAFENTEGEEYLAKLFEAFGNSDNVGFCIDTGHEMCYNRSQDLITRYGSNGKLIATHLNDNMAITGDEITWLDDSHMLPFDGVADWEGIARRINATGFDGPLTFELTSKSKPNRNTHDIYANLDCDGFVKLALKKAKKFREMIEK